MSADQRSSSGAAEALAQQLIGASKRTGVDTYTATMLLHASQMIDRLTPALPSGQADSIRERGRHYDIIIEALADYEDWMLDDNYNATTVLNRIMKRVRERLEMTDASLMPSLTPQIAGGVREALELLQLQQRGRARAFRIIDAQRDISDPITLAQADAYEECGNELRAALSPQAQAGETVSVEETLALIQAYVAAVGRNTMNCNLRPERNAAWEKVVKAVEGLAHQSLE